jgi:hypothetical protein
MVDYTTVMSPRHVVVDGSNIATEGRNLPSLAQLDQAVREFLAENPEDTVTVVVDASFGHRIDPSEVPAFEEAEAAGELVSPPAGAIGRGDAFLLRIAEKTGATVLSNDSFQEFHGEHEWVFDKGRLIGGKPVPGVGWIFTPRTPVRGPKSREAVKEAKRKRRSAEEVIAEDASGLDLAASRGRGRGKKVERAIATATSEATGAAEGSRRRRRRSGESASQPVNEPLSFITFIAAHRLGSEVTGTVESFSSHGAYVLVEDATCYLPLSAMGDPPPRSAREVVGKGETRSFVVQALDPHRRGIELAIPGFERLAAVPTEETVEAEIRPDREPDVPETAGPKRRRRRSHPADPTEVPAVAGAAVVGATVVGAAVGAAEPGAGPAAPTRRGRSGRVQPASTTGAPSGSGSDGAEQARPEPTSRRRSSEPDVRTRVGGDAEPRGEGERRAEASAGRPATKKAATKKAASAAEVGAHEPAASTKKTAAKKAAASVKAASVKEPAGPGSAATEAAAPERATSAKKAAGSAKAATSAKAAGSAKKAATSVKAAGSAKKAATSAKEAPSAKKAATSAKKAATSAKKAATSAKKAATSAKKAATSAKKASSAKAAGSASDAAVEQPVPPAKRAVAPARKSAPPAKKAALPAKKSVASARKGAASTEVSREAATSEAAPQTALSKAVGVSVAEEATGSQRPPTSRRRRAAAAEVEGAGRSTGRAVGRARVP